MVNRGVAVWKGKVYVGAIDGRLIALDAGTGQVAWEVQTTDHAKHYTITGAPRVVKDKVIIGNGGAEYGVRGYITAYDAATGAQAWRFYTVPGDPERAVRASRARARRGDLDRRVVGGRRRRHRVGLDGLRPRARSALRRHRQRIAVDAHRTAVPAAATTCICRRSSRIRPDDGHLVWHYQTTPGDNWDFTAVQHIVLADLEIGGQTRKVLMQAPKNGFFYVLDRATGELLSAEKYVQVNWAEKVDLATGRPIEIAAAAVYDDAPKMVFPGPSGGHNWHPMAWSPKTRLMYIPAREMALTYPMKAGFKHDDRVWNTGLDFAAYLQIIGKAPEPAPVGKLIAWDPAQGKAAWTVEQKGAFNGGILATAGNLVFQGRPDGVLVAYAADTGKVLWETETSIGIIAPPVTYKSRRRSVRRGARRLGRQHHRRHGRRSRDRHHPREHGPDAGVEAGRSRHHAAGAAEEPRHPRAAAAHGVGRDDRSRPPDLQRGLQPLPRPARGVERRG